MSLKEKIEELIKKNEELQGVIEDLKADFEQQKAEQEDRIDKLENEILPEFREMIAREEWRREVERNRRDGFDY